jgi:hypothetical protein
MTADKWQQEQEVAALVTVSRGPGQQGAHVGDRLWQQISGSSSSNRAADVEAWAPANSCLARSKEFILSLCHSC